jgi:hypothetical protein
VPVAAGWTLAAIEAWPVTQLAEKRLRRLHARRLGFVDDERLMAVTADVDLGQQRLHALHRIRSQADTVRASSLSVVRGVRLSAGPHEVRLKADTTTN